MKRSSVRPSVCRGELSRRAEGLLLSAVGAGDIDDSGGRRAPSSSGAAERGRRTVLSSKFEQCYVDS